MYEELCYPPKYDFTVLSGNNLEKFDQVDIQPSQKILQQVPLHLEAILTQVKHQKSWKSKFFRSERRVSKSLIQKNHETQLMRQQKHQAPFPLT